MKPLSITKIYLQTLLVLNIQALTNKSPRHKKKLIAKATCIFMSVFECKVM